MNQNLLRMKLIDEKLLNELTRQAKENARLRVNYNLHEHLEDKVQRLLNAMEPGTKLPIHRHRHAAETYFLIRGSILVKYYDDKGNLTEEIELNVKEGKYGIHIPAGQFHTLEVLESGTIIFEVKEGPYQPIGENDILKSDT